MSFLRRLFGQHAQKSSDPPPTAPAPDPAPPAIPISLTPAEAYLICEVVGGEFISGDSRNTFTKNFAEAIDDDWGDYGGFMLDYWESNTLPDAKALAGRVAVLKVADARKVVSAARRFWRLMEDDINESEALRVSGLCSP